MKICFDTSALVAALLQKHPHHTLAFPHLQGLYRHTEVSLQFIRWLRVSLTRPPRYMQAIEQFRPLMLNYL